MRLGIFARTFARPQLEEVFDAVKEHQLDCVQFNLACAGLPTLPDTLAPSLAIRIREASMSRSIEIAAVSGTYNMIQERLGNLLGNPETNPNNGKILQLEHYAQIQRDYQEVYNEAQEPQYLLNAAEAAVQRLESNPHEQIDFQRLTRQGLSQGYQPISRPGYPSESTWSGR